MYSPEFVDVTARADWFAKADRRRFAPGTTLTDILTTCGIAPDLQPFYAVAINGHPIPPDLCRLIRPKTGTPDRPVVVTIHPPQLRGGNKGTAKNVITIVASLALIAGTAFIGAGGLVALGAPAFFGTTAGSALAAAGFGIAGQIALQALAPPPIAANNQQSGKPDAVAGISGNPIEPFSYLPRVLGTMTLSPPFVARPWSQYTNGAVEVNAIVGLAGNTEISDILINGSPIDSFDDVQYETRDGSSTVTDLTLVTQCGFEQPGETLTDFDLVMSGGLLGTLANQGDPDSCLPQYSYYRTPGVADEVQMRLAFPAGIYATTGARAAMAFRVEIRRVGTSTWRKGPEIHFSPQETWSKPFRQRIRFLFQAMTGSAVTDTTGGPCFKAYGYTGSNSYNWQAYSYFRETGTTKPSKNVKIDDDGIKIYLSPATWPRDKYEFRIKRSMLFLYNEFDTNAYTWSGAAASAAFFDYYSSGGYKVRINQNNYVGQAQVEAFTTIRSEHPIGDKTGLALIAIKARKTRIDSISATFKSRARTFNGATWNSTYSVTDNPAALYREVLMGDLNARPLSSTMVDDFSLGLAYLDCASNGYRCAGVAQGYSVEQALQAIAVCAYAVPRQEEKWSMLLERDVSSEAPVQVLSPRIYRSLTIERSFDPVPHALRAQFQDEDNDFNQAETIVYNTAGGYSSLNATLFQALTYDLLADETLVAARADFDLKQLIYRKNRYIVEADWSHLVAERGALVGLLTDELDATTGTAVITGILKTGGNIVALYLDAPVSTPASFAGAIVQYSDGTTTTRQISEVTNSQYIEFVTPFADPGVDILQVGNLVAVGPYSEVVKRCKVFNIERVSDLQARVTLLDEAPEIYA